MLFVRFKALLRPGAWAPLLVLLLVAGCSTVPQTGRSQLLLIDPSTEVSLGADAFQQIQQDLDFLDSGPKVEMVRRVGERIARAAQPELKERGFEDLEWSFHVAESSQLNAFVLPNGQVVFYDGMMDFLEGEAEVAAVMGHEIAHVVGRHSGERLSQQVALQAGMTGAAIALGSQSPEQREAILAALGAGATVGVVLPYSRAHESEADEIGLTFMARAGYDPREAVDVWERMAAEQEGRPPEFLSTHPNPGRRAEDLRRMMPEALEIYQRTQ
jgi:predicted Zn-dependent protease